MRSRTFDFVATEAATPLLAWIALLAGALLLVLAADGYTAAMEEYERLSRQADKLQRRAKTADLASRSAAAEKSAPAGRRTATPFPWDLVLREIELAADRSVALTSLDTDVALQRTRLVAEARSIDAALAFASRLRATPLASQVLLLTHEAKKDPAGPVVGFSLQIDWSRE